VNYDSAKIDDAVLALLHLNMHRGALEPRAWKSFDWDSLERLHERGLISSPRTTAKSVVLSAEGVAACKAACERLFGAA
jgi:hypothetical protein